MGDERRQDGPDENKDQGKDERCSKAHSFLADSEKADKDIAAHRQIMMTALHGYLRWKDRPWLKPYSDQQCRHPNTWAI
jgi:hypothetical protein